MKLNGKQALERIAASDAFDRQKPIIDLLHQEIKEGTIHEPAFFDALDALYRSKSHPPLLAEIKRMQNRFKTRAFLGKDLLRLTSPLLDDAEKQQLWREIRALCSVYNESCSVQGIRQV